jgi:pimeloyl-ACP methyl ester carboxylesterase
MHSGGTERNHGRQLPIGAGVEYDPESIPFRTAQHHRRCLAVWDAIKCPVLLLRGEQSDLLSAATARAMAARGPKPTVIEFANVGHAPMLIAPDQIAPVAAFLRGHGG